MDGWVERLKLKNNRSRKWVEWGWRGEGAFARLVFAKEGWENWDGCRSVGNDRPVVKISWSLP